jgi:hypothetical protein
VKRGGELKRSAPMRRTGFTSTANPLIRQAPVKAQATKRKPRPAAEVSEWIGETTARRAVKGRSGGWCEIQLPGCFGRALDWHHRRLKGQGGLWQVSNGLHLCRWCHEAVTNTRGRRAEFEANGWLVRSSGAAPAGVSALIHTVRFGRAWVLLDDRGGVALAPWPPHPVGHPDDLARGVA